ncbi:hypothetical protein BKG91_11210 [Rodentibacter caecimuris]|uniref:Uncharacterized protein n=2 Tax=Rodentibacter caecimuris TaxID=1796644 RepID=A0A9X8YX40_9PAST|nr:MULTISPECIES: hemerythrin domain-containing protein [Pasteurellaceae]AOF53487.1 TPR repeat protein [Pasteurellaceae bacterium NI1060]MCQ9124164.1 hemerythrin domain-containing protein [Rodentibacter heylii]MCR1837987.1 hemerythrin domain-containing protein [Pasteurella caecimuris]MCU0108008.1 hemerythrin domain-containing protein [Pasteurella caecimuris]OOF70291.1 hypothetical protein BKG90_10270 [Rodentibacter heylii]
MQILEPQQFATWNEPIDMLYACHGKVKRFCHQLSLLPDYLEKNGINQAVLNDIKIILQYFNQAAPLHHDDEEKDFFPALMAKRPETKSKVAELERQHLDLHKNWFELSKQLEALIAQKTDKIDSALIQRFISGYANHIAIEEPLFELGKQYLSETELNAIGQVMSKRRHP